MKIFIKNFRGIVNKELSLLESGTLYLSGNSECGKSSTLEAIVWALYGSSVIKNVTPLVGSKKTEVTLEYKGLTIVRTKTPNTLKCNDLVDEAAQALINQTICSSEHFLLGSYIQQKMKDCFLTIKPKEQLDFLNKLAFDVDIDSIKLKIRDKIKDVNSEITLVNSNLSFFTQEKDSIANSLEEYSNLVEVLNPTGDINKAHETLKSLNVNISSINSIINSLITEKNDPRRTLGNKIDEIKASIESLSQQKNSIAIVEDVDDIDTNSLNERIRGIQAICFNHKEYTNQKQKTSTQVPIPLEKSYEAKIKQAHAGYSVKIDENKIKISELKTLLTQGVHNQACPHCNGQLKVNGGKIVSGDEIIDTSNVQQQINALVEENNSLTQKQSKTSVWLSFMDRYSEYDSNVDIEELEDKILSIQTTISDHTQKKFAYNNYISNVGQLDNSIKSKEQELNRLIEQKDSIHLRSLTELDNLIGVEVEKKDNIAREIENTNQYLQSLMNNLNLYNQYVDRKSTKDRLIKQGGELDLKMESVEKDLKKKQHELSVAHRLEGIVSKSQLNAVESVVEALNTIAHGYLETFFPNCGTDIRILPFKENKNGSIADKVSIKIIHNGIEFDSVDNFSGGAFNRAVLAFQIAVSDLINSPILMLDEALTGIQSELKEDIIETVKVACKNKLVLVVEHNTNEFLFDSVINY